MSNTTFHPDSLIMVLVELSELLPNWLLNQASKKPNNVYMYLDEIQPNVSNIHVHYVHVGGLNVP